MLLLALAIRAAAAAEPAADHDVELLVPRLGQGAFGGVDSPTVLPVGGLRPWFVLQYEHQPVIWYDEGSFGGAAVGARTWASVGLGVGATRWLDLGIGLPFAYSFASSDTPYTADGPALGDVVTTLRARPVHLGAFSLLVRAEAAWPVGTRDAWMSDPTVRPSAGLVLGFATDRVRGVLDVGALGRPTEDTHAHWTVSPEVSGGASFAWVAVPERLDLNYALVARVQTGDADELSSRAVELRFGVTGHPGRGVDVTAGAGVGLSGGVGEPVGRGFLDLRWLIEKAKPKPVATVATVEDLPDEEPPPPPPPPVAAEVTWAEGQLARVEDQEITIRDPIQFEFGKEVILPESQPTLEAIAALLRTDGRILHVVIQGHASDEGSFIYNYDLSSRRARAVWEALVAAGVHPDRISYQGMGEVVPVRAGEDEAALAANRRVVFRIVRLLEPGESAPVLPSDILYPWNGAPGTTVTPAPPPPPPPPPKDEDDE